MKFILFICIAVVLCYPFFLAKDGVPFFVQKPEHYFFNDTDSIFNNTTKRNKFLQLFFFDDEIKKKENFHLCSFKDDILKKNKEISYSSNNRLIRLFNFYCEKSNSNIRYISHPHWKSFVFKTNDGKKFCKKSNNCATIIEDGEKLVLGWDSHRIEVFYPYEKFKYKFLPRTYDLGKAKNMEELNESYLNSFVEIKTPSGGIGNQLFSYWTGVVYALKNKKTPLFYSKLGVEDFLDLPFKTTNKVQFKYEEKPGYVKKYVDHFASNGSSAHRLNPNKSFIYLNGYFQSWENFKGYEDYIREHTIFANKMNHKSNEISKKMQNENSVSIHVRRGDYIWQGYILLTNQYYDQAIEYIKENIDNPHFYIFSNDITWTKENLKLDVPHTFVDWNKRDYEDLQLMTFAKHHIIANSTFSWWGAFLSKNKNKIVIAPDKHSSMDETWIKPCLAPDFIVVPVKRYYYDRNKKEFVTKE